MRTSWLLWAIPVVGLGLAVVLWVLGSPVPALVVAVGSVLTLPPLIRTRRAERPLELTPQEATALRAIAEREGELAAIVRLRQLRPGTRLGAAVRTVRKL